MLVHTFAHTAHQGSWAYIAATAVVKSLHCYLHFLFVLSRQNLQFTINHVTFCRIRVKFTSLLSRRFIRRVFHGFAFDVGHHFVASNATAAPAATAPHTIGSEGKKNGYFNPFHALV